MVKKIKKYLKFVTCCALITSLIAPNYAALSATDGSAFVTKSEFDSALSDFNARLTTFEAGINSKIDSQVTSYLDRNGIWSASEQILDAFEDSKAGFTSAASKTSNDRGLLYYYDGGFKGSLTNNNYALLAANNGYTDKTLVSKITKSGLLFLYYNCHFKKYDENDELLDDKYGLQPIGRLKDSVVYYNRVGILVDDVYYFTQEKDVSKENSITTYNADYALTVDKLVWGFDTYNKVIQFFVSANSPLYISRIVNNDPQYITWKCEGNTMYRFSCYYWTDFVKAIVY